MRRTFEQILAIYNSLAPSQRITFAALAVLIPAGFLFFAWNGSNSSMVPLSYGKVFGLDEMRNAEQSLKEAGLTKFRSEGRQILAPASEVEKYNAALLQTGSLPSHWAEELEKKLESTNPFMTSAETLRQTREALLGKHLRRMILGNPDIEDAEVLWTPATSSRSRFASGASKATVIVKTKPGRELTMRTVQALRDALTGAIPDLKSTDVTVYDQRKSQSFNADSDNDPLGSKTLSLLRESSQMYESRLKQALSHISPDVVVTVNVEIDPIARSISNVVKYNAKNSVESQSTEQKKKEVYKQQPVQAEPGSKSNQPRALATAAGNSQDRLIQDESSTMVRAPGGESTYTEGVAGLPKTVTVSVLIPEDYYTKAFEAQKAAAGQSKSGATKTIDKIKAEAEKAVKDIVTAAIPMDPNNANPKLITVNSYVPVKEDVPEIKTSSLETVTSLVSQWGGAVALALFAIWALWMLRGSMPAAAAAQEPPMEASITVASGAGPSSPNPAAATAAPAPKAAVEEIPIEEPPARLNDRDVVQNMVRENPELAVAIIGKWLQSAR